MKFKIISIILLALLCLTLVSAADFSVGVENVATKILKEEQAEYIVTITNEQNASDRFFFVYPNDPMWSFSANPTRLSGFIIESGESVATTLHIKPTDMAIPLPYTYQIPLNIESENLEISKEVKLPLYYKTEFEFLYENFPHLEFQGFDIPATIDPREENILKVTIKNRNGLDLKNVKLNLKSNIIDVEKSVDIGPLEKLTTNIVLPYSKTQEPATDTLVIRWSVMGNVSEYYLVKNVTIEGYQEFFERNITEEKSGLKKITTIQLVNPGTITNSQAVSLKATFFERLFSSSNFDYDITKETDGRYITWYVELEPKEQKTIVLTTSYVPLLVILIILAAVIIVLVVLYFILRSPVQIRKRGLILKIMEGGISELKIILNVKNISPNLLEHVEIIDVVPNITEIEHEFEVGTLKPTKILHHKKRGTIARWEIPTLEKYEERIITYKLRSKLSILGGLTLPSAIVRFTRNNRTLISQSNKFKLEMHK